MTEVLTAPPTDLADYRSWLQEMPDGSAYIIDPTTGQRVSSNRLPRLLLNDSRLVSGYRYLRAYGKDINLTIMQSQHGDAAHLDTQKRPSYEQRVKQSDVYFYEQVNWDRVKSERHLQAYRSGKPPEDNSFARRMWRAIADAETTVSLSADIEKTDHPVDQILVRMNESFKNSLELEEADVVRSLFVGEYLREQYIPGKLGYELARLQFDGWFSETTNGSPVNAFMTMGLGHQGLSERFPGLEPQMVIAGPPLDSECLAFDTQLAAAVRSGYIPAGIGQLALTQ